MSLQHESEASDPNEDEKSSKSCCPDASEQYQEVRRLLVDQGHQGEDWDSLAFSLALLPTLHGHGEVLAKLQQVLESPVFKNASAWAQGDWTQNISRWRKLLTGWDSVRAAIGSEATWLDPRPRISSSGQSLSHPMRGHGIKVSPLASALLVSHAFAKDTSAEQQALATRFDHLQAMLTAAFMQLKWSSGLSVQKYLNFKPIGKEFAPIPTASDSCCRAVRWLSEARQAQLLLGFPKDPEPEAFVDALEYWEQEVTPKLSGRKQEYPRHLLSYLRNWSNVLAEGKTAAKRRRTSGSSDGGQLDAKGIDGFIQSKASKLPKSGLEKSSDPEEDASEAGLADDDLQVPALPMVPVHEINLALSRQKWRAMHAAMADTVLTWDLRYIAAADADRLAREALSVAGRMVANKNPPVPSNADDALLSLMMMALGQEAEIVFGTRIGTVVRSTGSDAGPLLRPSRSSRSFKTMREALRAQIDAPVLLIAPRTDCRSDELGQPLPLDSRSPKSFVDPESLEAVAFLIPAIRPKLAASVDNDGASQGQPAGQCARNLLLPAGEVGRLLLEFWLSRVRARRASQRTRSGARGNPQLGAELPIDVPVWGEEHVFEQLTEGTRSTTTLTDYEPRIGETPIARVERFLRGHEPPHGHDRWTPELLRGHLGAHIEASTGDRTLAWLITCRTDATGQARLYYTQHKLGRLVECWVLGIRSAGLAALLRADVDGKRANQEAAHDADAPPDERSEPGQTSTAIAEDATADPPPPEDPPTLARWPPSDEVHMPALLSADTDGEHASQKPPRDPDTPPGDRLEPEQSSIALADEARAEPPPLAGWPWSDDFPLQQVVGAAFSAAPADVERLINVLRQKLSAPVRLDSRSSIREHHNYLLLFTLVLQGLCTALRAVRSPTTVIRALEQADRIREKAGLKPSDNDIFAGLADKETYYNQRARLVSVPAVLVRQLRILQRHQLQLVIRLDRVTQWQAAPARVRAMFRLDDKDNLAEVTVAWFKERLVDLGFPWPGNFWRAFVRTQMLERGCPAADLDALLGHRDANGGAIALHSTHDFRASFSRLQAAFEDIHAELKLQTVRSALLPKGNLPQDQEVILAPMHDAGPIGRGRSLRARHQRQERKLPMFWQQIHQGATDDDRRQVPIVFGLLRRWARSGNIFAALLCSPDPVDMATERMRSIVVAPTGGNASPAISTKKTSGSQAIDADGTLACDLELATGVHDTVLRLKHLAEADTRARFNLAASWFRLLLRARRALEYRGIDTPPTPLVAIVRAPSSPFIEAAVLGLPIVDGWRHAVQNWAACAFAHARKRQPSGGLLFAAPSPYSAEGWATALLMSAVVHGMLLDVTQLSMLLRRFCQPGQRDLPLSGPERRAHLDFWLPASGSVDRQTHRWWFDPMTELIWLQAPPMPRELRLGDVHPWLRRIALQAFPGSTTQPFEPQSFSDLVRCAETWWLARASRAVVASQRRQIDASSVLTARWGRLMNPRRLVAPGSEPSSNPQAARAIEATPAAGEHPTTQGETVQATTATHATAGGAFPLVTDVPPLGLDELATWEDASTYAQSAAIQSTASSSSLSAIPPKGKRRRRGSISHPIADFEKLALVASESDRASDRLPQWDPSSDDVELSASFASVFPWIEQVAEQLQLSSERPAELDAGALRKLLPPGAGPLSKMLVEFAVWLTRPDGGGFTGPPLARSFKAAAQAVLLTRGDEPGAAQLDSQTIIDILNAVSELPSSAGATPRSTRDAILRLAQFLNPESKGLQRADPDDDSDPKGKATRQSHADARILSHDEFERTMAALDPSMQKPKLLGLYSRGRLLLTLCFRLGLRPSEAYGLRLKDVTETHVYVLPYGSHTLKSVNARRRVPLSLFLSPDEYERLMTFVQLRKDRKRARLDDRLLTPPPSSNADRAQLDPKADRVQLDRLVHNVMRRVTNDQQLRLYHARHSFGTWLDLALRSVDHPEVLRFFQHLSHTHNFLERGRELAIGLFGSHAASLGRTSYAIARLVGHVGPAITHMHYIHGDDLVRAAVVEREALRVPKLVWMRLMGASTTYALFRPGQGFASLIKRVRVEARWRVEPVSLGTNKSDIPYPQPAKSGQAAQSQPNAGPVAHVDHSPLPMASPRTADDWISLSRIIDITQPIARGSRNAEQVAAMYGLPTATVESILGTLKARLAKVAQPGKRATIDANASLLSLTLSQETRRLFENVEMWMQSRAAVDPIRLRADLEFLTTCYDRRDRDFHVRTAPDLQRLTSVMTSLGMSRHSVTLVVRTLNPNEDPTTLPEFASPEMLGTFALCERKQIGVRVATKAASYAKWLGLMPTTQAGESCSNVLAVAAVLAISQLAIEDRGRVVSPTDLDGDRP